MSNAANSNMHKLCKLGETINIPGQICVEAFHSKRKHRTLSWGLYRYANMTKANFTYR